MIKLEKMISIWNISLLKCVLLVAVLDSVNSYTIRQTTDELETPASCSSPLGVIHGPINVQAGFTVDEHIDEVVGGLDYPLPGLLRNHNHGTNQAEHRAANSYIQVEFPRQMLVSGIVSQGSPNSLARVTHFLVLYSVDCSEFLPLLDKEENPADFPGNLFANTTVTVMFDRVFTAKCVRVIPTRLTGANSAMRIEFLGCEISTCREPITIKDIMSQAHWKRFEFDTEKLVSSLTIRLFSMPTEGLPAFILAYSRTCNFDTNAEIVEQNGTTKIFMFEENEPMLTITDEEFPVRAQCFAVLSPDPRMLPMGDTNLSHTQPLMQVEHDQYEVDFEGCDALESHDALDSCGKTRVPSRYHHRRRKRVVGGSPSVPGEWPWLVSLHFLQQHNYTDSSGLRHLCGASLIHPQWILTAAHCVDEAAGVGVSDKNNWLAVLGEHYQGGLDGTEQILEIEKIYKHPDFKLDMEHFKLLNDLALMKLAKPAHLSDYVNTVCLEPNYTFPDHSSCVTAGWGYTEVDGVGVELPHQAMLKILPTAVCAGKYDMLEPDHPVKSVVAIEESVICATAEEAGIDSCQGDSGGPLMCYHDDHWTQVGVVSFGYGCGDLSYPGVYTKINHFYDWIHQTITEDEGHN